MLFTEASMMQMRIVKETIDRFCKVACHKVNAPKTNFFSKNVDSLLKEISDMFGFSDTKELVRYLRVLSLHKRVTMSTYQFILDKMR